MKISRILMSLLMISGLAQTAAAADESDTPEVVGGTITQVDTTRNRVKVKGDDGVEREFDASKETLQDLKVGDRIEAKRRHGSAPDNPPGSSR